MNPVLSIVVPTRNEEANIAACLDAFAAAGGAVETVVVDNGSDDRTRELAAAHGARVFVQGPERCAQRNRGWREARGAHVMFVDADMVVPPETLAEVLGRIAGGLPDTCLYVREVRAGRGLRIRARNFERSFYDGTCVDAVRVVPRALLERTGGYDERLVACEDWDLDRRLAAAGARTAITAGHLVHNESRQGLGRLLAKKAYYAKSVAAYRAKWGDDATCRRQLGLGYRYFGVFFGRGGWRRLLRHPVLALVMYLERIAVGLTYLLRR